MSRTARIVALCLLASFMAVAMAHAAAAAKDASTKTGTIQKVDAKAKTLELNLEPNRPLTFKVTDKTVVTLDGKASTFEAAIKAKSKATVTYERNGEDRIATKVAVKSPGKAG